MINRGTYLMFTIKKSFVIITIILIFTILLIAEDISTGNLGDYYNELKFDVTPRQVKRSDNDAKYAIWQIAKGNYDTAIEMLREAEEEGERILEVYYSLSMAYAQKDELDSATYYIHKAVEKGLPFDRFLAGPRNLFKPLYNTPDFKKLANQFDISLVHGPMIGSVTPNSATVWVRTVDESNIEIKLSQSKKFNDTITTRSFKSNKKNDFTAKITVNHLKPNTLYYYRVYIDNKRVNIEPLPSFKTYMKPGSKQNFSVGFGGGSTYIPENEHVWDTILERKPLAFMNLGDYTYFNIPDVMEHQQYFFYRRESRPEYRRLTASTAMYFVWDDHDFGGNDSHGGPDVDKPSWKKDVVLPAFKQNTVNPGYGKSDNPGCYYKFSIGDVDFFMLDTRYYRTDPIEPLATMLGPVQKQWLLQELKESEATFKVIASSIPFKFGVKKGYKTSSTFRRRQPGIWDTWQGFSYEREEIFNFIEQNKIEGVFLISADRHRSDAYVINRPNGYDLYEAMTSHITKNASHEIMENAVMSHKGGPKFGLLSFEMDKNDPAIKYSIVDIDNKPVDSISIKRSQLEFK